VKFISENLIRFTDFLLLRELVTDKWINHSMFSVVFPLSKRWLISIIFS
jgi:hypothetical protein